MPTKMHVRCSFQRCSCHVLRPRSRMAQWLWWNARGADWKNGEKCLLNGQTSVWKYPLVGSFSLVEDINYSKVAAALEKAVILWNWAGALTRYQVDLVLIKCEINQISSHVFCRRKISNLSALNVSIFRCLKNHRCSRGFWGLFKHW